MPNQNNSSSHAEKPDLADVELVFGTPKSPKNVHGQSHDVHTVAHEKTSHDLPKVHHKAASEMDAEPTFPNQPLLEPHMGRQKPPLAGPEIDDLDVEKPATAPYPGIDDGLLDNKENHEGEPESNGTDHKLHGSDDADDGKWMHEEGADETDFNYGDGFVGNGLHNRFDDRPISPIPGSIPDVNTYQQKKNLAQGMMDLALLSANANQLRYVLESSAIHPYYYPSLVFISCSIILQIAVGVGLIMNSRYDVKDDKDICKADKINNMTVLGIFLVTIVNVFITSFSVATPTANT